MKRIIFSILVLIINFSLWGLFEFHIENPAAIAQRNYSQVIFPGLTSSLNFSNNLLRVNDISMFEDGNVLTSEDKEILTRNNLRFFGSFNTTILDLGYRNWNLSVKAIGFFDAEVLDKTYTKIIFYGNETDKAYSTNVGKDSEGFAIWKSSVTYAHPQELTLSMIPGLLPEKSDGFLEELKDMPIHLGARFNINRSLAYAGVVDSRQKFGSMPDSAYYDIYAKYAYSDGETKGATSASIGFGLQAKLYDATFNLSFDDLFLKLTYQDLAGGEISQVGTDSLLYFQEDHEIFEYENIENDSLRISSRKRSIRPSFSIGVEYTFPNSIDAVIKYTSSELSNQDGLLLGASYQLAFLPLQLFYGNNGIPYYQFNTGLKFQHFEWKLGTTFYNGFFGYAKGMGLHSGMAVRF